MNLKVVTLLLAVVFPSMIKAQEAKIHDGSSFLMPAPAAVVAAPIHSAQDKALRRWKVSLIPFAASQVLDIHSSWGMVELNGNLAGVDHRFGPKAAGIKIGFSGAFIGIQYVVVRKWPKTAKVFTKVNWAGSALTTSYAVHNYAIR